MKHMVPRYVSIFAATFGVASCLAAQDTRAVIEPFFPQLCKTVDAQLQTTGGSLPAVDEQKLDTARIQKAIDKCGKGRAVLLHVNETNNAFLSGPLELRPDVTLIVGLGVTLFASRDPALFAVSPGSCGIVSHGPGPSPQRPRLFEPPVVGGPGPPPQRQGPVVGGPGPRGCKPLISVDHAPDSAIMGDGVIDGRGGEKMLGSEYSWWDLAEQARAGGSQQVPGLIAADSSDNFTLYRITLRNSPDFHVVYNHGNGFTVWGLKIDTPQRLARNTNGVDVGDGAKNVTITQSYIQRGDQTVAIQ
jgi:polygalacturonase